MMAFTDIDVESSIDRMLVDGKNSPLRESNTAPSSGKSSFSRHLSTSASSRSNLASMDGNSS